MSKALQVQGLSPSEKLCLIGIANHDGDGGAWPSQATLARYMGCHERNVRYTITRLVEKGYVVVSVNAGGTDKTRPDRRPNRYTLNFDVPEGELVEEHTGGNPLPPVEATGGNLASVTGGNPLPPNRPKQEPSKKPLTAAPLVSHFGGTEDAEKDESKRPLAPSRQIVGLFDDEWHKLIMVRADYAMFPRLPHKVHAYKWLNDQYFKPKVGEPRSVEHVSQLVHNFMRMVRYDEITPKQGYSAWQCFVAHISRVSTNDTPSALDRSKVTVL